MHYDSPLLLIAERDPFMRDVLARALQPDFRLEFVEDGAAALERVRRSPPALVILEALLPTLDGFQVCRRIKEDPATRRVRVLFLTLLAAEERAEQVGADAFLRKPVRRDVLLETVRQLLTAEDESVHRPGALEAYPGSVPSSEAASDRAGGPGTSEEGEV